MANFFERGFLATVGLVSLTQERSQALVEEMVRRGEVSREESKRVVDELFKRGQEERRNLHEMVREEVNKVLAEKDVAAKDDLDKLMEKIDILVARLDEVNKSETA